MVANAVWIFVLWSVLGQAGRPTLGPSSTTWLWMSLGLEETIATGADDRVVVLTLLSTDLRPHTVEVTLLSSEGHPLGRRQCSLAPARFLDLDLESVFTEAVAPGTRRFNLVLSGLEISPAWLVISLRSERAQCGDEHPAGLWVQADPAVVRTLLGGGGPGGS
jgi:hypothetical protein